MIYRKLELPPQGSETFFLWGPRQSGKSTLLRETYRDAYLVDLLKAENYRKYLQNPEYLRLEIEAMKNIPFIVIDEIPKVPALLDEVHWLIENKGAKFALCGSSARKVKRGHANLLGGRALRFELFGFVSAELGSDFDLNRMLNHGYLPSIYLGTKPKLRLDAYVSTYLKEEVVAESLVRNLPAFSSFLSSSSLSDTELVNFSTIGRDCGVSSHTIQSYFDILVDTLLGKWLPAYTKRPKRKIIAAPKFYFADVGVVNFLSKRGKLEEGSELYGKAFENWIHHELTSYNMYAQKFADLSYWRLTTGVEVDFIVNSMELAIEAKSKAKITSDDLKGLRNLKEDHPHVEKRIVVCREGKTRKTEDGIYIMSVADFTYELWSGGLF